MDVNSSEFVEHFQQELFNQFGRELVVLGMNTEAVVESIVIFSFIFKPV